MSKKLTVTIYVFTAAKNNVRTFINLFNKNELEQKGIIVETEKKLVQYKNELFSQTKYDLLFLEPVDNTVVVNE